MKNAKEENPPDSGAAHTFVVLWRALGAVTRQIDEDLQRCGMSNTDFRVLEALLHKGPLPVNVIGPKVSLTAGAISVAIDRLEKRALVQREQNPRDRRIRTVTLADEGKRLIVPVYQRHILLLERVLAPLSQTERHSLESMMKMIGKNAETLAEMPQLQV